MDWRSGRRVGMGFVVGRAGSVRARPRCKGHGAGGAGRIGEANQAATGARLPVVAFHVLESQSGWIGLVVLRVAGRGSVFAGTAGWRDARSCVLSERTALRI